ncbi:MAG: electron transport complex subunit RsxC [Candidatus Latescibacteria bacterium]|nr:electron transport complex subunit RsxC [bacterium]MBD3424295.1 electron transport complex subunit RsxC [Candidatus Latescibacterota bacterium]
MAAGFFGGVHPAYSKEMASGSPIRKMPVPESLVVQLHQNLGAPPEPVIKRGDEVKRGQLIAKAAGFVSANVHSPVSGKVKSIGMYPSPVGSEGEAAAIIPDQQQEWAEGAGDQSDLSDIKKKDIPELIKEAGIVGMGGAAFPTHVKLMPPENKNIDILIINGAECEPFLTADHRLMLENGSEILEGARLFARAIEAEDIVVAIENNKPDAIEKMRELARGTDIRVEGMDVIYPQGAEKQLIFSLTGRKVPAGGLPMDVGALVQNVGTCYAAFQAASRNIPLIERVVTVTGSGVREPGNVLVPIGTRFGDVIDFCGGMREETVKLISGGPMMGVAQYSLEASVTKGTSGILLLGMDEVEQFENRACIRCGRCLEACPMRLNPSALSIFAERIEYDRTEEYNVMDCIECGCCAYVCPSRRPMVHHFRKAKAEIRKKARG